jgi:predicted DCC family thiol-disulfide oxidoreductase YuxK
MTLKECTTLINIEGTVYKLSDANYRYFKDNLYSAFNKSNSQFISDSDDSWSNLLHWVQDHGTVICNVETYNF